MYVSRTRAFRFLTQSLTKAGLSALLAALLFSLIPSAQAVGSWTPLANQAPDAIGTMLLLTDGTVMAQGASGTTNSGTSAHWFKLTPDAHGSYAKGAWTQLADMHHERLYYASTVLRNGKVFVAGGEYTEAGYVDTNTAEVYDPAADAWTEIAGPPGWDRIGDAPVKTLFDGTVLLGSITSYGAGLYNYTTNTWTAAGNTLGGCDEASWALLPDQSVLTVDINTSPNAEKYLPSSNTWVRAGQTPAGHDVVQTSSYEIGPGVLLTNGKCLFVGATGHTALYAPPSDPTQPGSWQAGPDFPTDAGGNRLEAKDAPGCLMVNGKVLCVVAPHGDSDGGYPYGQQFFEYTYDGNGGTLTAAPDSGLDSANTPAFTGRMLALPSGQVLYSNFNTQLAVYTPDGSPASAWKPVVSGVSANADGSYQVSGTQFNGLSEGAYYGDDASESTNYPLVRLTDKSGVVTYARTFNHSTMGVATGSLPVSTNFTTTPALAPGAYQLQVVANGIASDPVGFRVQAPTSLAALTLQPASVQGGAAASGTVTLTGPAPAAGFPVSLTSNSPSASAPASLTVPGGASSATFSIQTSVVTASTAVTFTAIGNAGTSTASSATATLTVTPLPGSGKVRFYPRFTWSARMVGGKFQGSNDGVAYTDLYTVATRPPDGQWTEVPLPGDPKTYRFLRYVGPAGGQCNIAELEFYSGTGAGAVKLTGTPFGSPGSYDNSPLYTFDKAFDGDTSTFPDLPDTSSGQTGGQFVGIDQGHS